MKQNNRIFNFCIIFWLYNDCISIYLSGSSINRAKRLAERDNIILEEALKIVERRDLDNQSLYTKNI